MGKRNFNGFYGNFGANSLKSSCFLGKTARRKKNLKKVFKKFGETNLPVLPLRPLWETVFV